MLNHDLNPLRVAKVRAIVAASAPAKMFKSERRIWQNAGCKRHLRYNPLFQNVNPSIVNLEFRKGCKKFIYDILGSSDGNPFVPARSRNSSTTISQIMIGVRAIETYRSQNIHP